MNNTRLHPRGGWSPEETDMLFQEIAAAEENGSSIKSVFDKVAQATGRKPNSIRNYYYLKIKENSDLARVSFVPFTDDEVDQLLRTMLRLQADGRSVRGIAMELGGGDKKAMLRYQNKYRSVDRTDPQHVRENMAEQKQESAACIDPFRRRHRSRDLSAIISELLENLSRAEVDPEPLFSGLLSLSRLNAPEDPRTDQLMQELSAARRENMELRERCGALSAVCQSFIEKNGVERIAGMNDYVAEIRRIME